MPRFVILEHDHPKLHWDLMLESGTCLRSWRLEELPELGKTIAAEPSFDHRLIYLDFEGPVSGNRGDVVRLDTGSYEMNTQSDSELVFRLQGRKLSGLGLIRKGHDNRWSFRLS